MTKDRPHRTPTANMRDNVKTGGRTSAGVRLIGKRNGVVIGIGIDIVDINGLTAEILVDHEATARAFTADEIKYCLSQANPPQSYAGTLAAKQAVVKALGTGWDDEVDWLNVNVQRLESGAPRIVLSGGASAALQRLGARKVFVTIAHDGGYAVACSVLES
jgi:holo-[acyl-carrier protein] synthase